MPRRGGDSQESAVVFDMTPVRVQKTKTRLFDEKQSGF
jgi:hypothetical protein